MDACKWHGMAPCARVPLLPQRTMLKYQTSGLVQAGATPPGRLRWLTSCHRNTLLSREDRELRSPSGPQGLSVGVLCPNARRVTGSQWGPRCCRAGSGHRSQAGRTGPDFPGGRGREEVGPREGRRPLCWAEAPADRSKGRGPWGEMPHGPDDSKVPDGGRRLAQHGHPQPAPETPSRGGEWWVRGHKVAYVPPVWCLASEPGKHGDHGEPLSRREAWMEGSYRGGGEARAALRGLGEWGSGSGGDSWGRAGGGQGSEASFPLRGAQGASLDPIPLPLLT